MAYTRRPCQALLRDQSTPCPNSARGGGPYCRKHGREYANSTQGYKSSSAEAEQVYPDVRDRKDIRLLTNRDLEEAIQAHERYLLYVRREITEREIHQHIFFRDGDPGHDKWLAGLHKKCHRAEAQLQDLTEHARRRKSKARAWKLVLILSCTIAFCYKSLASPSESRTDFWNRTEGLLTSIRSPPDVLALIPLESLYWFVLLLFKLWLLSWVAIIVLVLGRFIVRFVFSVPGVAVIVVGAMALADNVAWPEE